MTYDVIFDSALHPDGEMVTLASGYISLTKIGFVKEQITVAVEAKTGAVDFYDEEDKKLLSAKIETPAAGDEKFSEVKCMAESGIINLGFPRYTYKDNYPHCDGEHDRWTKTVAGYTFLSYDMQNNAIVK